MSAYHRRKARPVPSTLPYSNEDKLMRSLPITKRLSYAPGKALWGLLLVVLLAATAHGQARFSYLDTSLADSSNNLRVSVGFFVRKTLILWR